MISFHELEELEKAYGIKKSVVEYNYTYQRSYPGEGDGTQMGCSVG